MSKYDGIVRDICITVIILGFIIGCSYTLTHGPNAAHSSKNDINITDAIKK